MYLQCEQLYKWVEQNRTVFEGEVVGPLCLHANVGSDYHACILEQHVAVKYQVLCTCKKKSHSNIFVS
jgi:hypothetical protein